MITYWQELLHQIHWQFTAADVLGLALLAIWLWIIWPAAALRGLMASRQLQWRALVTMSIITGLWLFNASIHGLLQLHLLGLVTLMLMFSWRLASVLVLPPTLFYCIFVLKAPALFGAYALLGTCAPLFIAFVVYNRSFHWLPKNVFVLIFISGFLNGGLSLLSHEGLWSLWIWGTGMLSSQMIWQDYLSVSLLLMFPEALLNGMAITLLVVYRPDWLADYSDRLYLWRR